MRALLRLQVSADAAGLIVFNVLGSICFGELDLVPLLGTVAVNSLCFSADLSHLTVSASREEAGSTRTPLIAVLDTSVSLPRPVGCNGSVCFAVQRLQPIATRGLRAACPWQGVHAGVNPCPITELASCRFFRADAMRSWRSRRTGM
jgi:hypothetical protein